MNTDLTFITNENNQNLLKRFKSLIKDTRFFDVLVAYFYSSGFYAIFDSLKNTEKIRILIGIGTDRKTYNLLNQKTISNQIDMKFSHSELKEILEMDICREFEETEDKDYIENGVTSFIEWIKNGKLQIKAYPSAKIHAKLYIMSFKKDDRDKGRVITGSSNFTVPGLIDNLEFNVELKERSDYEFALNKFNELWNDSIDVSEKYIETINNKTWLREDITPYELYLKFLYEYFRDELSESGELFVKYIPEDFKKLEYQEQAVLNAKKILEEYGGVFISDVVGLGKTYISAMLAGQLDGRTLIIAPPVLIDKNNPGSWRNVFSDFRVHADYESVGKLDKLIEKGVEKYSNIIIDEAHRFRTETSITYEKLAAICRGKRIILVSATPYNNSPKDILSQIKLFQNVRKSNIPNLPNLEYFFNSLDRKLKNLDRQSNYDEYISTLKENAREIREKVLKYLIVRRTREEIKKYFSKDLEQQKLKFPEVADPVPIYYELNDEEDYVFTMTVELMLKNFNYSRYTPLLFLKEGLTQPDKIAQVNMMKFMKILLLKRLESSFYAFKNSIKRFIYSYERFIKEFDKGRVYISKKYINKIFEFLEEEDVKAIQELMEEGKAECFKSEDFKPEFKKILDADLLTLKEMNSLWEKIIRDPKLDSFIHRFKTDLILKTQKLIIFTESKETAEYLTTNLNKIFFGKVLCYTGSSGEAIKEQVIENFDAKSRHKKNDYRILISTEVLAEGVNLHQSNVVINYDIPWNPTRMMQRVGRINRVDTKHEIIYTYNFFPTKQSNDIIKLEESAKSKINAFISLLGADACLLTEGEPIEQHELFSKLNSKKTITGEDESVESELKYLNQIKDIRDNNPELFSKIKKIPKKSRTSKNWTKKENSLLTYFKKGKLHKFYISEKEKESLELDFLQCAGILEADSTVKKNKILNDYFELLDKNKQAFIFSTTDEFIEPKRGGGRDSAASILKILKAIMKDKRQLTEEQEEYLKKVLIQLEIGALPKQTTKSTLSALNEELKKGVNVLRIIAILQTHISERLLQSHYAEQTDSSFGKREVILSEYLTGETNE